MRVTIGVRDFTYSPKLQYVFGTRLSLATHIVLETSTLLLIATPESKSRHMDQVNSWTPINEGQLQSTANAAIEAVEGTTSTGMEVNLFDEPAPHFTVQLLTSDFEVLPDGTILSDA